MMPNQILNWIGLPLLAVLLLGSVAAYGQVEEPENWREFADAAPFPEDLAPVPSWRFARGPHVRSAFRKVVAEPSRATVRVRADGNRVAYGGIVRSDGWIVTKASQLSGEITCRLADGRRFEARVVAVSGENDIALLKVEAKDLPVLIFSDAEEPPIGAWLATVGIDRDPVAVGVMSVEPRKIARRYGVLGVNLVENDRRAMVASVFPETGAARAGILQGDIITAVNEIPTPTLEQLQRTIRKHSPGDKIVVDILRRNETLTLSAILTDTYPVFQSREEFQNHLGGDLSQRRFGFPDAFQHDTVLKPRDCGGPLVNLDGETVGFNLARAGRTETYAISAPALGDLVEQLMQRGEPKEE